MTSTLKKETGRPDTVNAEQEVANETPRVCPIVPLSDSIHVRVNFQTCRDSINALVDTGANCSCISTAVFNNLPSNTKTALKVSDFQSAKTAGGADMNIKGQVTVQCTIGKNAYLVDAYVIDDLITDMVLGQNFLKENNAMIDIAKSQLRLRKSYNVKAQTRLKVEPDGQEHVYGIIADLPNAVDGQVTPHPNLTSKGLYLANSLSTPKDGKVLIRLMNANSLPITVPKNMSIGVFQPINQQDDLIPLGGMDQSENAPQVNNIKVGDRQEQSAKFVEAREKLQETIQWGDCDLTEEQKGQLLDVLAKNAEAFSFDGELGKCDLMTHKIDLEPGARPVYKKPYRYSPRATDHAKQHIQTLLEQDVIEPCISPWSSPLVIVNKPRKSPNDPIQTRMCVDFRGVNEVTVPDRTHLPRLDNTIDRLGTANPKFFSTIDLIQGFFQQVIDEESRPITAFTFEGGQYCFKRLPMGLKNSPASYTRLLQLILRGIQYEICLCYIDDIVIYSQRFDDHLGHIDQVLQRLIKANLKVKIQKCCFAKSEISFLGNRLSSKGWSPDPEKTRVIREYQAPKTKKELRRWLGMIGFYRKFIPHYAVLAAPLYKLLKVTAVYEWSKECEQGFQKFKEALLEAPVLGYPDFNKPFLVYTDASYEGLSAMLAQKQEHNGEEIERVLWYSGRALGKHEKNYTVTDLELTAVHYAAKQFLPYIQFNPVTFYTDHRVLQHLENSKPLHGRLARIDSFLSTLDKKIVYRPGSQMAHADCISRFPNLTLPTQYQEPVHPDFEQPALVEVPDMEPLRVLAINSREKGNVTKLTKERREEETRKFDMEEKKREETREMQLRDPDCVDRIDLLKGKEGPKCPNRLRILLANLNDFFLDDGLLYRVHYQPRNQTTAKAEKCVVQLVVPQELQQEVIRTVHEDVHFSYAKVFAKLTQQYWWPSMMKAIKEFCAACLTCQKGKIGRRQIAPLQPIEAPEPWHTIGVDIVETHVESRTCNKYILVFIDLFTRYCEAFPLRDMTANTVAKIFHKQIVCRYGPPQRLLSDRGSNFTSKLMMLTRDFFGVQGVFTSSYHPEADGATERMNQTIIRCLRFLVNEKQDNWDECLPNALYAYNTSPSNRSTDYTPFFLLFGRYARSPLSFKLPTVREVPPSIEDYATNLLETFEHAQETARENIQVHQRQMKEYYDKHKKTKATNLKAGDKVFLYMPKPPKNLSRKLCHPWIGPYYIEKFIGESTVKLRKLEDNKRVKASVHVNRLKKCFDPKTQPKEQPPIVSDPTPEISDNEIPKESLVPLQARSKTPPESSQTDTPAEQSQNDAESDMISIEKILGYRDTTKEREYMVKWESKPPQKNSWVAKDCLSKDTLEYLEKNPVPPYAKYGRMKKKGKKKHTG